MKIMKKEFLSLK
jgi:hypothetical protein